MIRPLLLDNARRSLQAVRVEQTIGEDKNDDGTEEQNTIAIDIEWGEKLEKEEEEEETRTSRQRERDPCENDVDVQIGRWEEEIDRKLIMQAKRL